MVQQDEGELLKEARWTKSKTFWHRLKRDHRSKFSGSSSRSRNVKKAGKGNWTLDKLAAKQKFEQLKLLTTTDLSIANSAEPHRVSSFNLLIWNLLDPTRHICTCILFLLCRYIVGETLSLSFLLLFASLIFVVNRHIDSYRSFVAINESVERLSSDYKLRKVFLGTHLGYDPKRRIHVNQMQADASNLAKRESQTRPPEKIVSVERPELIDDKFIDSFHWINKIIAFFWPYLSHLIHFELNQFFRDQIESGSLGRSKDSLERLYYAILRQFNTNVLAIERCQLGDQSPFIKNLACFRGNMITENRLEDVKNATKVLVGATKSVKIAKTNQVHKRSPLGSTLVLNIDLEYNGDMDLSVIYRYLCCCSSRLGLKDVFLHFQLQIVFGPIKQDIPFIDQVSFTLLEKPEFGYKGIALVELAELRLVRNIINRLIADYLLYPRIVTVELSQLMGALINGPPVSAEWERNKAKLEESRRRTGGSSEPDVPLLTRLTAKALLFGLCCSNFCLRSCQTNRTDQDGGENVDEGNWSDVESHDHTCKSRRSRGHRR